MTVVSTLGRGVANGLAGALVWIAAASLVLGDPDPRRAAVAGLALALAVVVVAALSRLR